MGLLTYLWLSTALLFPHGDLHQQIADLSKTISAFPDSIQLYQERGVLYLLNEDIKEAQTDFFKCIHSGLLNSTVYIGLSKTSYYLNEPDSALYYIDIAVRIDSMHYSSLEWRASLLLLTAKYCKSALAYSQLLSLAHQPSPSLIMDAAQASLHCPDALPSADQILLDGIAHIGRLHVLEKELVLVYLHDKRYEDALQVQTEMIEHWSFKATPYLDRAETYLQLGQKNRALEDLHQALLSIDKLPAYKSSSPAMKEIRSKIISLHNQLEG
jgi:tetratricopeptide (TPR) repeat protein